MSRCPDKLDRLEARGHARVRHSRPMVVAEVAVALVALVALVAVAAVAAVQVALFP